MSRRRTVGTVLQGMTAIVMLVALVVGLPVLLYRLGGTPVPARVPSWDQIGHALLHRDSGGIFLGAVRDISWLAWAAFTVAVLAEAQAAFRGRTAPKLRMGGLQTAAGRLVALAVLSFSGPGAALLAMPQQASAAVVTLQVPAASATPSSTAADVPSAAATASFAPPASFALPESSAAPASAADPPVSGFSQPVAEPPGRPPSDQAAAPPGPQVMSMGFYQLVTVRPGDCLWTIAQHYLGDGDLYPEIVKLNLGHDMGGGRVFADPGVIWPGWMLQLPAAGSQGLSTTWQREPHSHAAHLSREPRFRKPHQAASPAANSRPATSPTRPASPQTATAPAGTSAPSDASAPAGASAGSATAGHPQAASEASGSSTELPPLAVFAAGMLAGGAAATLARMRHRQRQSRRLGRRIPLPVSAPVMTAERRLRAQTMPQPATALRAALSDLGAELVSSGQQLPDIAGIRLLPSAMEVLLASPASEPPPPPFTVPGGRQGMAWHLSLPGDSPQPPFRPAESGDLLPGLLTAGAVEGGYLLVDLEYLRVTTVDGPPELADQVLTSAAAELLTSELAGWYDLILVGFDELECAGGRATSCASLEEALDLLAAKAVALRRNLGDEDLADVRRYRLAEPDNEDWALAMLVSRTQPTSGQLALLLDLASDPAGIAALVPGGTAAPAGHLAPASMQLADDPGQHGGMVARILPLQLQAWPQPLDNTDYLALASMFATAAEDGDVAAEAPPYDGSSWPPFPDGPVAVQGLDADDLDSALTDGQHDEWPDDGGQLNRGQLNGGQLEAWPPAGWQPDGWPAEVQQSDNGHSDGHLPDGHLPDGQLPDGQLPEDGPLSASLPITNQPDSPSQPSEQASLRVGVLGTLTINGAPGALQPAQSQLVLVLALSGRDGLSNQQLCYLLGADPDHPKPSDSLRQLIVRTRRQLGRAADGREWIEHLGGGQYALHAEARFDWDEFDALTKGGIQARDPVRLREALRLIRGQPFTGCYHWSLDLALIETVRAQIVDAAEVLSGLELAAGDNAAAARAARTGLAGDAGAEQLWRALMRAEHSAGNMTGVREAWSRCLDAIADVAADGEPHPETAKLYRQLIEGSRARPAWSQT